MFRVPTYLAPSPIHGIGVFTPLPIAAGTILWEFTDGVDWTLTKAEFLAFPEPYRTRLDHYCFLDDHGRYVLCGDNARFMNHCVAPNCDDSGYRTVAMRDIAPGEELTCDYRTFDQTSQTAPPLFINATATGNGAPLHPGPENQGTIWETGRH